MASELIIWLGGDVFDAAIQGVFSRIFRKRLETARLILLDELENGDANLEDVADKDEAAAMVFDYANAAMKGTARRNLRMIAQLIRSQLVTPPIYPDTFLELHRTLGELTRHEIIVLAKYHCALDRWNAQWANNPKANLPKANIPRLIEIRDETIKEGVCENNNDYMSVVSGLVAKGLLVQIGNVTNIEITPKFEKIVRLINFESVNAEPER
jgi:hypothetical protein